MQIIDFHVHLGKDKNCEDFNTLNKIKKSMKRYKITKVVIFPFNRDDKSLIEESKNILRLSKKNNFIIPFLRFNPNTITKSNLQNLLNLGFKGVKLHPSSQKFNPENKKFFWIYKQISDKQIPLLFHTSQLKEFSKPIRILNLAKKFPKLNFVVGHFLGNDMDLMEKASKLDNVYIETSIFGRALSMRKMIKDYNLKLLFGSDMPYDTQAVVLKIYDSGLTKKQIQDVLFNNAKKLLKL